MHLSPAACPVQFHALATAPSPHSLTPSRVHCGARCCGGCCGGFAAAAEGCGSCCCRRRRRIPAEPQVERAPLGAVQQGEAGAAGWDLQVACSAASSPLAFFSAACPLLASALHYRRRAGWAAASSRWRRCWRCAAATRAPRWPRMPWPALPPPPLARTVSGCCSCLR